MRILRNLLIVTAGLGLAGGLGGCSGIKSVLGLDKKPPDEFAVVTKTPLVVPPDFDLRPPKPGARDSQEMTASDVAEQTVFGRTEQQMAPSAGQSNGELALLEQAGAEHADPAIRNAVASESKGAERKDDALTDRLMFWKGSKDNNDVAVNGPTEQSRIQQNDAEGKPVAADTQQVATNNPPAKKGGFFRHLWPF